MSSYRREPMRTVRTSAPDHICINLAPGFLPPDRVVQLRSANPQVIRYTTDEARSLLGSNLTVEYARHVPNYHSISLDPRDSGKHEEIVPCESTALTGNAEPLIFHLRVLLGMWISQSRSNVIDSDQFMPRKHIGGFQHS